MLARFGQLLLYSLPPILYPSVVVNEPSASSLYQIVGKMPAVA